MLFCIKFMPYQNLKLLIFKNDIIYFSDSVMKAHSACEKIPIGIDDILRESGLKIINLNHSAYSPILYKDYIRIIPKGATVIVPINLRSFSEEWFYFNQYRFIAQRIVYSLITLNIQSLYQSILDYLLYTQEKYYSLNIIRDGIVLGDMKSIQNIKIDQDFYCYDKLYYKHGAFRDKLSIKYKTHYMYKLNKNHEMFVYIKELIDYSKNHDIRLIFYITPINIDHGNMIVGESFKKVVSDNINVLKQFFSDNHVAILDLSHSVSGENFIDQNYVCEHVDYIGRNIIARSIKKLLSK